MTTCTECEAAVFARGLCQKHYWRQRRHGRLERINDHNKGVCRHPKGCTERAHAKGLCWKHYQQARGYHVTIWKNIRATWPNQVCAAWMADLERFKVDVGDRPAKDWQLRRLDPRRPWEPSNVRWQEPLSHKGSRGSDEERAEYAWAWHLRNKYGLTPEQVVAMAKAQHDRCPICTDPLGMPHPDTGNPIKVCVDHCHATNKVRGLLCDPCNKGLGSFRDSVPSLRAAIAYLERHEGSA